MCLEYLDNGCARKLDDVLDSVLLTLSCLNLLVWKTRKVIAHAYY